VLTELGLVGTRIHNTGATRLGEVLAGTCALQKLDLSHNMISDTGATWLGQGLARNSTLTELDLGGNRISDEGAAKLGEGLACNSTLTKLDLGENEIQMRNSEGATMLGEVLVGTCALRQLNLHGNRFCATGATKLGERLARNTTLTELDLGENKIGDEGAAKLGEGLACNSTLTKLDLRENGIGDGGGAKLAEGLARNRVLQTLNVHDNLLGPAAVDKLAVNTTLTDLDLTIWPMDEPARCKSMPKLMEGCTSLASLAFRDMGLSPEVVVQLAASLAGNASLTRLDLCNDDIYDLGATKLGAALAINSKLLSLILSYNEIGDAGAAKLAEGLAENCVLQGIDLGGNYISAEGVGLLCKGIAKNDTLKRLDLSGISHLGAAGLGKVADMLVATSTLQELHLASHRILPEEVDKFADALRVNSSLSLLVLGWGELGSWETLEREMAPAIGSICRALQARPRTIHKRADGSFSDFELRGVKLGQVVQLPEELGLPHIPAASAPLAGAGVAALGRWSGVAPLGKWSNAAILAFFWEQHERRLAVCMLAHGRLGQGSRWGALDAEILRMVLGYPIHYDGA